MNWMDTWLFPLGSVVLGGVGLLVLWRGLFGRRFLVRKTRACRRCRYDMTQTDGPKCPECGYAAKHEGEHYAGRRRWLVAGLGLMLMLGAIGSAKAPHLRWNGWAALLPISWQAQMWDGSDEELHRRVSSAFWAGDLGSGTVRRLRDRVVETAIDPKSTGDQVQRAASFINQRYGGSLLGEPEFEQVLLHGRPGASVAAMLRLMKYEYEVGVPVAEWRRVVLLGTDLERQEAVLRWVVRSPAGDEDAAAVGAVLVGGGHVAERAVERAMEGASPESFELLITLLEHPSLQIRRTAVRITEGAAKRMEGCPDRLMELLIEIAQADHTELAMWARRAMEDVPGPFESMMGDWLDREDDPARLEELVHVIQRRRPGPSELAPKLVSIAADESHRIGLRLDAADAYSRVRNRDEPGEGDAAASLIGPYQVLAEELTAGNVWAWGHAQEHIMDSPNWWSLIALARTVPLEIASVGDLEIWLDDHPLIEFTILGWSWMEGTASERLITRLVQLQFLRDREPRLASEAGQILARWSADQVGPETDHQ